MLALVANIMGGIGGFFTWAAQRMSVYNSPQMQQADEARKFQEAEDKINSDIAEAHKTGNLDEVRKDVSS